MAIDSIRNRVYVANPSTTNITVIDGNDNRLLFNIPTSDIDINPLDLAINPFKNIAYIVGNRDLATEDTNVYCLSRLS